MSAPFAYVDYFYEMVDFMPVVSIIYSAEACSTEKIKATANKLMHRVLVGGIVKLKNLASLEGLEPTTYCLEGSRSIQLSYRDEQDTPKFYDKIHLKTSRIV
jgi:hypothetical protein